MPPAKPRKRGVTRAKIPKQPATSGTVASASTSTTDDPIPVPNAKSGLASAIDEQVNPGSAPIAEIVPMDVPSNPGSAPTPDDSALTTTAIEDPANLGSPSTAEDLAPTTTAIGEAASAADHEHSETAKTSIEDAANPSDTHFIDLAADVAPTAASTDPPNLDATAEDSENPEPTKFAINDPASLDSASINVDAAAVFATAPVDSRSMPNCENAEASSRANPEMPSPEFNGEDGLPSGAQAPSADTQRSEWLREELRQMTKKRREYSAELDTLEKQLSKTGDADTIVIHNAITIGKPGDNLVNPIVLADREIIEIYDPPKTRKELLDLRLEHRLRFQELGNDLLVHLNKPIDADESPDYIPGARIRTKRTFEEFLSTELEQNRETRRHLEGLVTEVRIQRKKLTGE